MHQKRISALCAAVNSLMDGASLTLTSLARNLAGQAKERHRIRKMDRLLGNQHLHLEKKAIYCAINKLLIKKEQPIIAIDWSCLSSKDGRYLLRASVALKGRSLVCYEEVHPKAHENNTQAQNAFLDKLKAVLPEKAKPIIVTDAIFSVLWFKKVCSLGWEFVGRVRQNRGSYYDVEKGVWCAINKAYADAQDTPKVLREILLTKQNKLPCTMIGYKKKIKGRIKKNRKGEKAKGSYNDVFSQSQREPWLLVTSLPMLPNLANKVVRCYATRMQIEEEFRDTKSRRYGFGLSESGSKIHKRVEILLVINFLAAFFCWILGCTAVDKKQHYDYHANSLKTDTVLSRVFIGRRIYQRITNYSIVQFRQGLKLFLVLAEQVLSYDYA